MEQVTTPYGIMNKAGSVRANVGVLCDLFIAMTIAAIVVEVLNLGGSYGVVISVILIGAYIILAHRGLLPSLGQWALGLHRFKYSQIEEYQGKGSLVVYENLEPKIYTVRAVISVLILVTTYLVARYFV